jgi:hypothetical protein
MQCLVFYEDYIVLASSKSARPLAEFLSIFGRYCVAIIGNNPQKRDQNVQKDLINCILLYGSLQPIVQMIVKTMGLSSDQGKDGYQKAKMQCQ